jgi:type II secretory pathway component PulJ
MERRLLALLESERLRAADRERESDQRMRQQTAELVAAIGAVDSALRGAGGRTTNGTPDERTR